MAATIRQFGLAATDSTRVADGLTQAANASFNSVESLGEALQYAGPVAADANLSLEETLAILGALGNVGIQGSEAGTALRRLLVLTQADAESMKKIFGVDALDANRNARPILDVLDEVNQATQNLPSGDRAKKFSEFFGLLGITAASAIGKNAVGAKSLLAGIQQATGVASRTAKEMDAGLGGSLRRLWSAVEGVAIAFGESLAPHVDFVAGKLTEFAGVVTKVLEENPDLAASIASIAAGAVALGAALVVLGPAITAVGSAFGVAATAMSVLASPAGIVALTLALADQGEAATVVGQSISDLAATWDGATADIAAAIAGIRAAIAAGDVESAMKIMTATLEAEWIRVCDFMERRADQLAEYLINKAYDIGIKWGEYTLPAMGFGIGTKRIDINSAVIGTRKPAPAAVEMSPELRAALEKVRQLTESAKAAAAAFDPSKDEPESAETKAAPWDQLIKKFIPPVEAAMQKIERTFSNGQFGGQLASQIFGTAGDQIVQVARNTGRTVDKLASIERKMGNGNLV
jgi:TP901 family phage tail tape measure protein